VITGGFNMTELQRKIELQSIEDLQFLVGNIQRGAEEKIDQALPPMDGAEEDAMRKRVEQDVHSVSRISRNVSISFGHTNLRRRIVYQQSLPAPSPKHYNKWPFPITRTNPVSSFLKLASDRHNRRTRTF
jgi:hypothetical protein